MMMWDLYHQRDDLQKTNLKGSSKDQSEQINDKPRWRVCQTEVNKKLSKIRGLSNRIPRGKRLSNPSSIILFSSFYRTTVSKPKLNQSKGRIKWGLSFKTPKACQSLSGPILDDLEAELTYKTTVESKSHKKRWKTQRDLRRANL